MECTWAGDPKKYKVAKGSFMLKGLTIYILLFALLLTTQAYSRATDKSTDNLNSKLKSVNEHGEIDEYRATLAEVLVTKNEAQAMQQLNKLLNKYRGTPLEAGLLFRKAELFVRQSKSARFFEFNRSHENLLTLIPKSSKSGSAKSKIESAVDIYEQIERRFPNYADLDLVLFNNAFLRQHLGQEKTAERIFRNLLSRFPESYLVPDTHLAVAEMLYHQRRYQEALVDYEAIKKYPGARVYTYGIYKTGWAKYQLKDVDGAIKELETVITLASKPDEQGDVKVNLKSEALSDLVLFYPEARKSKDAYAYFKKWASEDVGKYILMLAQMYERHSNFKDQEVVLFDYIDGSPQTEQVPMAWKAIIETDIQVKNYDNAIGHLAKFESHCLKYFKDQYNATITKVVKINRETGDDKEIQTCPIVLSQQSLKLSQRWHNEWKKKHAYISKVKVDKADQLKVDKIADATELAYSIYLRNSLEKDKLPTVRFNYSELLFQRKKFRLASQEYFTVAQSIKDEKIKHDSSYFSIVSLESAVGDKWSDADEDRYLELADFYLKNSKNGKYEKDIKYKRAFIAYEKGRYNEALPTFKELGWKGNDKMAIKSQDLYIDILNIQKKYKEIIEVTDHLIKLKPEVSRRDGLLNIYRESYFAHTVNLEKKGNIEEAAKMYYKFALENKDSKLADKAFWNYTQILIKTEKLADAAQMSYDLYKQFPKSEFAKPSLLKSVELFEYTGNTRAVATSAWELSRVNAKETLKWQKIAADFYILSADYKRGIDIYKELLKLPDSNMREDIVSKLLAIQLSKSYSSTDLTNLIAKYGKTNEQYQDVVERAKSAYERKDYSAAFKMASQLVGEKSAPSLIQAQARLIQADILKQEFEAQSTKTKVERIQVVLGLKTEKLDKAQRAYQSVIRYGNPETTVRAFLNLAKMYEHYVLALKNIQITDEISEKDLAILKEEIEKIAMPIEEKVVDTLQQGLDFSKKHSTYDGYAFELRNELNRLNFKGLKFVKYNVDTPKVILPTSL